MNGKVEEKRMKIREKLKENGRGEGGEGERKGGWKK